jgi:hypothetical protein
MREARHALYDADMGLLGWIVVAVASAVGLAYVGWSRRSSDGVSPADLGSVSEGWLSDERGRKTQ